MATCLTNFPDGFHALIQGASRGVGLQMVRQLLEHEQVGKVFATSRHPEKSDQLRHLRQSHRQQLHLIPLDVTRESSVRRAASDLQDLVDDLDLLFNVAGLLHDDTTGMMPEKSLSDLEPDHLRRSFDVNAIGPLLVAKHFYPLLQHDRRAIFANMSARVGSIGDNYKGGWYGYRASKAAQNQFTRTLAIEFGRRAPNAVCVALHPGTVDTDLSAPFQSHVPDDQLQSPAESVSHLFEVIDDLDQDDSGEFFDWAGEPIEW
jgi:NAD(P)-dependent dehydrogenase (short-subunit alcohol dehydrogenase family)